MKIVSVFDGCAGARLALDRAGIPIAKYYASEVDKYAITIANKNYPDIIQLGDIRNIRGKENKIDLLIGGSPCQGFSVAGKQKHFDDERSKLFFEFIRLKEEMKPKWFLLENVHMKKESEDVITKLMGVEPIMINSNLVSAQERKRLYWTNIPVTQPEDKNILLYDILEGGFVGRDKSYCVDANYGKGGSPKHITDRYVNKGKRQVVFRDEAIEEQRYVAPYLKFVRDRNYIGFVGNSPKQATKVYPIGGKSQCLTANGGGQGGKTGLYLIEEYARKLTPIECERLQTLPYNYTDGVSDTQRYKMIGNGFTVDVIAHILGGMKNG